MANKKKLFLKHKKLISIEVRKSNLMKKRNANRFSYKQLEKNIKLKIAYDKFNCTANKYYLDRADYRYSQMNTKRCCKDRLLSRATYLKRWENSKSYRLRYNN